MVRCGGSELSFRRAAFSADSKYAAAARRAGLGGVSRGAGRAGPGSQSVAPGSACGGGRLGGPRVPTRRGSPGTARPPRPLRAPRSAPVGKSRAWSCGAQIRVPRAPGLSDAAPRGRSSGLTAGPAPVPGARGGTRSSAAAQPPGAPSLPASGGPRDGGVPRVSVGGDASHPGGVRAPGLVSRTARCSGWARVAGRCLRGRPCRAGAERTGHGASPVPARRARDASARVLARPRAALSVPGRGADPPRGLRVCRRGSRDGGGGSGQTGHSAPGLKSTP